MAPAATAVPSPANVTFATVRRELLAGTRCPTTLALAVAVMAFDFALVAVGVSVVRSSALSSPWYWLWQLLLPLAYFHSFALLHDAGHRSISRCARTNSTVGHLASPLCFMPFYPWKLIHEQHHRWTGNIDRDPTLAAVKRMRRIGRVPLVACAAFRLWIPLSALAQHVVLWSYPLRAIRDQRLERRDLYRCLFSIAWLALVYAVVIEVIGWHGVARLAPSIVAYLLLVELVNLPHHLGMAMFHDDPPGRRLAPRDQHQVTRSCRYPAPIAVGLALNFNHHIEHHAIPTLPWYRLSAARRGLAPLLEGQATEEVGIGWNLEYRRKGLSAAIMTPTLGAMSAEGATWISGSTQRTT